MGLPCIQSCRAQRHETEVTETGLKQPFIFCSVCIKESKQVHTVGWHVNRLECVHEGYVYELV